MNQQQNIDLSELYALIGAHVHALSVAQREAATRRARVAELEVGAAAEASRRDL